MDSLYAIKHNVKVLFDSPQQIDFHIRSGDYFPFLATLIGFIEESLSSEIEPDKREEYQKLTHELRTDLRYVHANYKIVPRTMDDIQIVRPKGNLLNKNPT